MTHYSDLESSGVVTGGAVTAAQDNKFLRVHSQSRLKRLFEIFHETYVSASRYREASQEAPLISEILDIGSPKRLSHGEVATSWAATILSILNIDVQSVGRPVSDLTLWVGNHLSYLDVPLLMSQAHVVFVAKAELGAWPVIGRACREVGTILVQRESAQSRRETSQAVSLAICQNKKRVAIFPSGTTCIGSASEWRLGAFKIAKMCEIPIQPFRINYYPLRASAYIDNDSFLVHLWRLARYEKIMASIEFHDPIWVDTPETIRDYCRAWCEAPKILNPLSVKV